MCMCEWALVKVQTVRGQLKKVMEEAKPISVRRLICELCPVRSEEEEEVRCWSVECTGRQAAQPGWMNYPSLI